MKTEIQATEVLKANTGTIPNHLIILGSGWSEVLKDVEVETEISYKDLFGVEASVPGHEGRLVIGSLIIQTNSSKLTNTTPPRLAFMAGRLHMYEGYTAREATLPIRVLAQAGVKQMIVTSASGALNEKYQVGDFVILSDLLTLFMSPETPLQGPDFVDMSEAFDPKMRQAAREVCVDNKIEFHEGVYAYCHGPQFETPADKMALHHLGADVVGMSTVPETIMARSLGVSVMGLSCVTNLAFVKHDHHDVLAAANQASQQMVLLLKGVVSKIS